MNNPSFNVVNKYVVYQNGIHVFHRDRFDGIQNVVVDNYLYSSISVTIYYSISTSEYKVDIIWEEDSNQIDYKELDLHGSYSTNFQNFTFDEKNNVLSFQDGPHKISIYPV